jgi:RNA polymerase sigma factor (sigma-70 family)
MTPGSESQAPGVEDDGSRVLHACLLQRDPTAPSELAETYLPLLVDWLRQAFPREDGALLETLAIDLVLGLAKKPEQYDPDRGSLTAYLRMAARGDVKNAQESTRRRYLRLAPLNEVELRPPSRNRWWASNADPSEAAILKDADARVAALREHFHGHEREVVDLIVDGERRTESFARVLGLLDRPREEQVREVKRAKDRLKKRMKRYWQRVAGDG